MTPTKTVAGNAIRWTARLARAGMHGPLPAREDEAADLLALACDPWTDLHLHAARPLPGHLRDARDATGTRRHDHHAVGEQDRLRDAVGDEEDRLRPLLPHAEQLQAHLLAGHGVEGAEGLVHEQEAWVVHEGAAQGHPLLHAAGQLPGILPLESGQA